MNIQDPIFHKRYRILFLLWSLGPHVRNINQHVHWKSTTKHHVVGFKQMSLYTETKIVQKKDNSPLTGDV